jgi:hypothetical protein
VLKDKDHGPNSHLNPQEPKHKLQLKILLFQINTQSLIKQKLVKQAALVKIQLKAV